MLDLSRDARIAVAECIACDERQRVIRRGKDRWPFDALAEYPTNGPGSESLSSSENDPQTKRRLW